MLLCPFIITSIIFNPVRVKFPIKYTNLISNIIVQLVPSADLEQLKIILLSLNLACSLSRHLVRFVYLHSLSKSKYDSCNKLIHMTFHFFVHFLVSAHQQFRDEFRL